MQDDVVAFSDDELMLVAQRRWQAANQIEQAVAARFDAIRAEILSAP